MNEQPESQLLASAKEFLAEALRNLNGPKLRFAIVHAITATELVLKERLARLNPVLILKDIDTRSPHKERSVSLSSLPRRMANLGMPLTAEQTQLISDISEWRHEIVHHAPTFDEGLARRQLPKLLDFVAGYLREELGAPLQSFLPRDLYGAAHDLLDEWHNAVTHAQRNAMKSGGRVISEICPRCGAAEVMCLGERNAVHCHLCQGDFYHVDSCDGCGRPMMSSFPPLLGDNFCSDCIEDAGERYIQSLVDQTLGK